jgi:hypothetical protein
LKQPCFFTTPRRVVAVALALSATTLSIANDTMKINSAQPSASSQSMKPPQTTRVNDATMTTQRSPALPTQPAVPMKPPTAQLQGPRANVAQQSSIQMLNQSAIVAGETLTLRVYGMTPERGSAVIKVRSDTPNGTDARGELALAITQWDAANNLVRGTVAPSRGLGDGHAKIIITLPSGGVIASGLQAIGGAQRTTVGNADMPFIASRAEQTIAASAAQPNYLLANLPEPAAREVKQGTQLLNAIAYSRIYSVGDPTGLGCRMTTPQDRFKLKLAAGFDLVRVNGRDLNAGKRYGLTDIGVCDIRSAVPAASFVQSARDGSFVVNSTWDVVNRLGATATAKSGTDCGGSRYLGVTKTPLGFDWDNTRGTDRCAANAEYVIDAFVVRGPAGVNPFFGTSDSAGATIK